MTGTFRLARRYLGHHRGRTALVVASVACAFFLPLAVQILVGTYQEKLEARAAATPLVIGAPGSRYDLVLSSLYFTGRVPAPTTIAEVDKVQDSGLALAIPLRLGNTAQKRPVVGTAPDYFDFRGLVAREGTLPLFLGECVAGATVAKELGLHAGSTLLTDQGSLYDLSMAYPLKMHVVGVLAETGGADDGAVFCDVKTAWIIEGIGHGHEAAQKPDRVLTKEDGNVAYNAALVEFTEVTPENIDSFHFHGEPGSLPVTAILAVPKDAKSSTLLKGRYRVEKASQLLVPSEVVDEILGFVFQVKRFFDANFALVAVATALFLVLTVLLTLRVRQREFETLFRIGCARAFVARLMAVELAIVVGAGLLLSAAGALALVSAARAGWLPI